MYSIPLHLLKPWQTRFYCRDLDNFWDSTVQKKAGSKDLHTVHNVPVFGFSWGFLLLLQYATMSPFCALGFFRSEKGRIEIENCSVSNQLPLPLTLQNTVLYSSSHWQLKNSPKIPVFLPLGPLTRKLCWRISRTYLFRNVCWVKKNLICKDNYSIFSKRICTSPYSTTG